MLICFVMLIWVRLEALPFHIPPRTALQGFFVIVGELHWPLQILRVGADRRVRPNVSFHVQVKCAVV